MLEIDQVDTTDAELLEQFVGLRDQAAFETLLRRHGPMVFGICRRILRRHHEAEDAFQNAFLSLAKNAGRIARPEMLAGWLYRVAHHAALKMKQTASERQRIEQRGEEQMDMISDPRLDQEELWSDLAPMIDGEIGRLSEELRIAVVLCDVEGKTRKEAAQHLGWPEGTVSTRLMKARSLLAKRLAQQGVVVSSVTLGVLLSQNIATAAVPGTLVASTLTSAMAVGTVPSGVITATFSQFFGFIKSVLVGKVVLAAASIVTILGVGLALQPGPTEAKKEEAPHQPTITRLSEIQQGMETTFAYLRNHCVAVDYRVDFENAPGFETDEEQINERKLQGLMQPWRWQEQQLFLEESKGRLYSSLNCDVWHSDPTVTNAAITIDGETIRWHWVWPTAENWVLVGDVKGFPTGVVQTMGAHNFRYNAMYDRYLKNIGYVLTNPYDRAFSVEYEPTDLRFIPYCFKKVKYTVASKMEEVEGDKCDVVEAPGADKMWIDPSHGFLLRKRIFKWRDWHDGKGRCWVHVTNTDLEKVADGVWLPRRSVVDTHLPGTSGPNSMGDRVHRETLVTKSLAVRNPMSDRQYHLEFPLGVKITDERSGAEVHRLSTKADNPEFDATGALIHPEIIQLGQPSTVSPESKAVVNVQASPGASKAVWGTHSRIDIGRASWAFPTWTKVFVGVNIAILFILAFLLFRRRRST